MVNSVSSGILVNSGHLLENLVFTELRRNFQEIYYYKTKSGKEVDFIVQVKGNKRLLIQACESLANPDTRKREIVALVEAMGELGLNNATIVTRNESEEVKVGGGVIDVVPAWRFFLGLLGSTAL